MNQVTAKEVSVSYKMHNYKITYDEKKISYRGPYTDLSIMLKDCNAHIIKEFNSLMNANLKGDFLASKGSESYSITVDNSSKYDLLTSKRALFFANFNEYFKALKTEEHLNCR